MGDYTRVFEANRDILPNTASLEVGQSVFIPCRDGKGPQTRAEALSGKPRVAKAPAVKKPEPVLAAVTAESAGVTMITGSDFAPFADQRLPEGGMVTELLKLAIERAAPGRSTDITFVNDWSRHLPLISKGEYGIGFPWYRPDCTKADRLDGSMQARCSGFVFSNPVFALTMGYYVRADDPLADAKNHAALMGKRICRPAGYFTFDLDQADLREPNVTRVVPRTAADCFTLLAKGAVDAVSVTTSLAEPEISRLGLDGRVTEARALATSQTLHAITAESNEDGRAYIEIVNQGLADLQASGRWFEIVSRHLGAFGMTIR